MRGGAAIILGGLATAVLTIFFIGVLLGFPIMWLWNYTMPDIFGLPELSFWQAFWGGLLGGALVKFLIGGGSGK